MEEKGEQFIALRNKAAFNPCVMLFCFTLLHPNKLYGHNFNLMTPLPFAVECKMYTKCDNLFIFIMQVDRSRALHSSLQLCHSVFQSIKMIILFSKYKKKKKCKPLFMLCRQHLFLSACLPKTISHLSLFSIWLSNCDFWLPLTFRFWYCCVHVCVRLCTICF